MITLNDDFIDRALGKIDECFEMLDKGMKQLDKSIERLFREKIKPGTKIRIKKGSTVYLGKGNYAMLLNDTEAIMVEGEKKRK